MNLEDWFGCKVFCQRCTLVLIGVRLLIWRRERGQGREQHTKVGVDGDLVIGKGTLGQEGIIRFEKVSNTVG